MSLGKSFPPRAGVAVAGLLFPGGDKTDRVMCRGRGPSSTAGCFLVLQSPASSFAFPWGHQTWEQHALPKRSGKESLIPNRDHDAKQDQVRLPRRKPGMPIAVLNSK